MSDVVIALGHLGYMTVAAVRAVIKPEKTFQAAHPQPVYLWIPQLSSET
jgi:hypothetical protein